MPFRTLLSLSSLRDKTHYTSPINVKQSSFFRSHKMNSTIFSRFLRALRRRQLKQNIWKMVWFSMSLYKFKSSRCSPCNRNTQRRRKIYRCRVSSSPIKRAKHETCKYDVNHHGWAQLRWWAHDDKQIHFFQCRKDQCKDQWIHLTDVGNFHTPFWDELHSMYSCNPSRLQHISPKFDRSIHIVRIVPLSTIQWTTSS